jgi:hypothetical protein
MRQGWELSSWLWRLPLAALLWVSASLILFALSAAVKALARGTALEGASGDVMGLRDLCLQAAFWSMPASFLIGAGVIFLTVVLHNTGRVSFAEPPVRRALWLAAADVAIPLALAAALLVYLWFNPPRLLMF